MEINEIVEVLEEMEKESYNAPDMFGEKRMIYNAPAIFSFKNNYKQVLIESISLLKSFKPPKEPIYYNCTLMKFAEQLNIPLFKAMEFEKYFDLKSYSALKEKVSVEVIEEIIGKYLKYVKTGYKKGTIVITSVQDLAQEIHNLITKELKGEV
jgi:hypothetical protein